MREHLIKLINMLRNSYTHESDASKCDSHNHEVFNSIAYDELEGLIEELETPSETRWAVYDCDMQLTGVYKSEDKANSKCDYGDCQTVQEFVWEL